MKTHRTQSTTLALTLAAVAGLAGAGTAHAATIRGTISADFITTVNIQSPVINSTVDTARFRFSRDDTAGPGVDNMLARNFTAYCAEANQGATLFESHLYNVQTGAERGLTSTQEMLLSRLWATKLPEVNTLNESVGFQLAVWEILYDTNLNVTSGPFLVTGSASAATIAQGYLNMVSDGEFSTNLPLPTMKFLQSSTRQDLITAGPPIPAAGTGAAALAGLGLMARRRRKAADRVN